MIESGAMSSKALEITRLNKTFGSTHAVVDLDLTIDEGEIFGLLGPNGAGKSTTINMIGGVNFIDSGSISIFGHDNQRDYRITRSITGVMHQEVVIEQAYEIGTALELHSGFYGVPDDPKWRQTLIDRLDLGPHLKKKMMRLSGGMKRRFMVAKALIHKPRFLILDEPTAGVDVELRRSLWEFVREINRKGTTVLLTTHYLEEAEKMCGRLAIMNHGKIIALDQTQNLVRNLDQQRLHVLLSSEPKAALLNALKVFSYQWNPVAHRLEFWIPDCQDIVKILDVIQKSEARIQEIETIRPDLEEVFVKLTQKGKK